MPRGRNLNNLHAIVITNFKVHRTLLERLTNANYCRAGLVEHDPVANHRNAHALIMIMNRVRRIDPLPFCDSLVGASFEFYCQIVYESTQLAIGNRLSIVKANGDKRGEFHGAISPDNTNYTPLSKRR